MRAPGAGMLKAASILFIVFGGIAAVLSILALLGSAAISFSYYGHGAGALPGILLVSSIIALIASGLEIVLGIVGLKKCDDPRQYSFFIVTGIILCVLSAFSVFTRFTITSLIGLALPILYIVGGYMNKNALGA